MTRWTMVAVKGRPSPLARPRRRRMPAISAQVWWSRSWSISAMVAARGLPEFPGRFGHRQGEGAGLAAGQADVRGDGVAGAGDGDVGEQQPGDALAFAHRGGGVVPDAGQVGDELGDPVLLGAVSCPVCCSRALS